MMVLVSRLQLPGERGAVSRRPRNADPETGTGRCFWPKICGVFFFEAGKNQEIFISTDFNEL